MTIKQLTADAKAALVRDALDDRFPADVAGWSDLAEHVDADKYALDAFKTNGTIAAMRVERTLRRWIRRGGLAAWVGGFRDAQAGDDRSASHDEGSEARLAYEAGHESGLEVSR